MICIEIPYNSLWIVIPWLYLTIEPKMLLKWLLKTAKFCGIWWSLPPTPSDSSAVKTLIHWSDILVSTWWWPTQKRVETCSWFLQKFANAVVLRRKYTHLTPSLLTSCIYMELLVKPETLTSYIDGRTNVWQRWKPSLSIYCTMSQHWINAESFPVSQMCENTLPAAKVTLITDGI
jgi:hypothetical protein